MKLDLYVLPLTDLGCQLWLVFALVNKVKDERAINASTDKAVIFVLFVLVVKVHKVN